MPMRCAALAFAAILAACAPADQGAQVSAADERQFAYAWPIAPGCRQRLERNPNFGNNVRLRPNGTKRPHLGVDIMPPPYDLHVYAANAGVVVENTPARGSGWGNYVIIRHDDGLRTLYGHLITPSKLAVGQKVVKGAIIGIAGQTETWYVHVRRAM